MSEPSPAGLVNTPSTLNIPKDSLSDFTGSIFVGVILNWGLFWCLAVQVYIYYISSKNDRVGLKVLVCFLFLAAIGQTSFVTYCAWRILVAPWGDIYEVPYSLPWGLIDETTKFLPIINGLISAVVQVFFSWRIWFLNQTTVGRVSATLIGIIAISQFIVSTLFLNMLSPLSWWNYSFPQVIVTVVWLAGNFLADVFIALCMLYTLRIAQRQSLSKGAKTIISRLMVNAVETGAITAVVTGAGLVFEVFFPNYLKVVTFILGPLFPNVCLANLNARARTRRLGDDPQFSTVHTSERGLGLGRANTTLRFAGKSTILAQSEATEP